MCFAPPSPPALITKVLPAPERSTTSGLASFARLTALRSRGALDTIASSPLGDLGFGKNVKRPTILGAVGPAYGATV